MANKKSSKKGSNDSSSRGYVNGGYTNGGYTNGGNGDAIGGYPATNGSLNKYAGYGGYNPYGTAGYPGGSVDRRAARDGLYPDPYSRPAPGLEELHSGGVDDKWRHTYPYVPTSYNYHHTSRQLYLFFINRYFTAPAGQHCSTRHVKCFFLYSSTLVFLSDCFTKFNPNPNYQLLFRQRFCKTCLPLFKARQQN